MKRHPIFLVTATAGLLLLGAGCGSSDSPVSLDKYQSPVKDSGLTSPPPTPDTSDTTPPPPDAMASTTASSTVVATASSTSSTTVMPDPNVPLAFPGVLPTAELTGKFVHIKTAKGNIVFEILPKEGPKAASNFYYLANHKFYDGLIFHRVEDWVVQGGDPTGTGTGGPGYSFQDDPVHSSYLRGVVAMANAGPNTNGSQFFILTKDTPLGPNYSIFGRVVSGMDAVDKIAVGDTMTSVTVDTKK